MANTSATGGPLTPLGTAPPSDIDLGVVLGRVVRGITGLPPGMVRPRWQEVPPQQPPKDVDWCAIGVVRVVSDGGTRANIIHDPSGDGTDILRRHEVLELMASFYGPCATGYAELLRDGLSVPQNREALFLEHMGLVDLGAIVSAPALINNTWRNRQDFTFRLRRRVDRVYAVNNLLEAEGIFKTPTHDQTWSTEN